jgi:hypothetical protein
VDGEGLVEEGGEEGGSGVGEGGGGGVSSALPEDVRAGLVGVEGMGVDIAGLGGLGGGMGVEGLGGGLGASLG